MAQTNASQNKQGSKRMEFKPVKYDINEMPPDAPAGEWMASIPRGKCKVQGTAKDNYPMLIVPIRLDSTEEDGDVFQKALGTQLSTMIVFYGEDKTGFAVKSSKMQLRQLCEAADVDLDVIPKEINDRDDLEPLIRALEGKKFPVWTVLKERNDTGEITSNVLFVNPRGSLGNRDEDDDDADADDEEDARPRRAAAKKTGSKSGAKRR